MAENDSAGATEFDLIVIGAGAVGENVADRAVAGGLSVAIVEHELVGGECSYWACMPSKALIRPGTALRGAREVGGAAEAVVGRLDTASVLARRDRIVHDWSDESQVSWLEKTGIELVRGHGRIAGERVVDVTRADGSVIRLRARHAVCIATGSAAVVPPIDGIDGVDVWTSRDATAVREIPTSLAIVGGGVVAAELATAFASLDCRVTLLVRSELLGGLEPFAGELVGTALSELGVDVRLNTSVTRVTRSEDGVAIELSTGDAVAAERLLVATGRRPRSSDLGLESLDAALNHAAGSAADAEDGPASDARGGSAASGGGGPADERAPDAAGGPAPDTAGGPARDPRSGQTSGAGRPALEPGAPLRTDDTMRVEGFDWLYAVGDVTDRAPFTHQGKYQARAAGDAIAARAAGRPVDDSPWGRHVATADHGAVPYVVFTDPEVASVGLTARAAQDAGIRSRIVDYDMAWLAGATVHSDDYAGRARLVIDEERDIVVGATFVGRDVAELVHSATVAIVGEVPISRLWHAVPSYPTLSEVWLRLLEELGRESATASRDQGGTAQGGTAQGGIEPG